MHHDAGVAMRPKRRFRRVKVWCERFLALYGQPGGRPLRSGGDVVFARCRHVKRLEISLRDHFRDAPKDLADFKRIGTGMSAQASRVGNRHHLDLRRKPPMSLQMTARHATGARQPDSHGIDGCHVGTLTRHLILSIIYPIMDQNCRFPAENQRISRYLSAAFIWTARSRRDWLCRFPRT